MGRRAESADRRRRRGGVDGDRSADAAPTPSRVSPGIAPLVSLLFLIAVGVMLAKRRAPEIAVHELDERPPEPAYTLDDASPDASPPSVQEEIEGIYYRVKRGDTLEAIAKRFYANAGAWKPIASINKIQEPKRLRAGRVIWIPALRMNP